MCGNAGSLTGTEPSAGNDGLRLLCLETSVQLKTVDITVELLGNFSDLRV